MTHSLDFFGISEKLFVLRQLAFASREYCKEESIYKGSRYYADDDWKDYEWRIRKLVGSYMIEIAAKSRLLEDAIKLTARPSLLRELDEETRRHYRIGDVLAGKVDLTLRESCNKILHASHTYLAWKNSRVKHPYKPYTYWIGGYGLKGSRGGNAWEVVIAVPEWCLAVENYLDQLGGEAHSQGISCE